MNTVMIFRCLDLAVHFVIMILICSEAFRD